jgi:hypothetical protein
MRIRNETREIDIHWEESPMEGKPLTRVWAGPAIEFDEIVTHYSGDTPEGRDREVQKLLSLPGWTLVTK